MHPWCPGWGCVKPTTSTAFCGKEACVQSYAKWFAKHYHKPDFDTNHVRNIFGTYPYGPSREAEKTQVEMCLKSICESALAKFQELVK
jgi:hypothetical protein